MSRIQIKGIALCAAAGLFLASCGSASYPKGKVAEKLIAVCKNEYHLDVKAQVAGTTLGAMVSIPGLVDEVRKHASSSLPDLPPVLVEGKYTQQALDFRMFARGSFTRVEKKLPEDEGNKEPSEPIKKLRHIFSALTRAFLSTDAPLEFYELIARDPGPDHLDIIFSGHILDSKKVQFLAISSSELQTRSELNGRRQPEELARDTVAGFLADLNNRPLPQLLSRYTAPSKRFGDLMPMVMEVTMEFKGQEKKVNPEEWAVRQIKKDQALVFVSLKPLGQSGAFLFTVHLDEGGGTLLSIEKLENSALPNDVQQLGPPERWSDFFYLEAISMPDFVTEQIAKRVMNEFKPIDPKAKAKAKKKVAPEKPATVEEVTKALVGAAAYVTDNYGFKNFNEVTVVDAAKGTRWVVPAAELPLYRRREPPDLKAIP